MKEAIFYIFMALVIACVFIALTFVSAEQHTTDKYLIHCKHQTSVDTYEDIYHVVSAYWIAEDGCLEARYHGEYLTDLCESCHVESQEKFDKWLEGQFKSMWE